MFACGLKMMLLFYLFSLYNFLCRSGLLMCLLKTCPVFPFSHCFSRFSLVSGLNNGYNSIACKWSFFSIYFKSKILALLNNWLDTDLLAT